MSPDRRSPAARRPFPIRIGALLAALVFGAPVTGLAAPRAAPPGAAAPRPSGPNRPAGATGTLHALLVALPAPGETGERPAPTGMATDVHAVARALGELPVRTLADEAANPDGLAEAWSDLVEAADPDDPLLLYLAGPGLVVPDDDGDEPDGLDEALALHGGPWRDDRLASLLAAHADRPGLVAVVIDAGVRHPAGDSPDAPVVRSLAHGAGEAPSRETGSGWDLDDVADVVLAASRASEPAHEIELIRGDGSRRTHGLLTLSMLQALAVRAATSGPATWRELADDVRRRVALERTTQTVVLEGRDVDLPVPPFPGVAPVTGPFDVGADGVVEGGRLAGLRGGDVLSVAVAGDPGGAARLQLVTVDPERSFGAWQDEAPDGAPLVGRLVEHGPPSRLLSVGFDVAAGRPSIADAFARDLVPTGTAVRGLAPRADVTMRLEGQGPFFEWRVIFPGGAGLDRTYPFAGRGRDAVMSVLTRLGIQRIVTTGLRDGPGLPIEVDWGRGADDGTLGAWPRDDAGAPFVPAGSAVGSRLVNRAEVPIWATLLRLGADGSIRRVFVADEALPPGETLTTGAIPLERDELLPDLYGTRPERLRWIVSRRPHDVSRLEQRTVSSRHRLRFLRELPEPFRDGRDPTLADWGAASTAVRLVATE